MNFTSNKSEETNNVIFHVTLADPDLYINGVYTKNLLLMMGSIHLDLSQMEVVQRYYQLQ